MLADCAPVTNPTEAPSGRPSSSLTQRPAVRSAASAAGDISGLKPFWSQPVARMSAALEAGLAPPITNPK